MIPLALVVALLMGQPIESDAKVMLIDGPDWLYGAACHDQFREIEGNTQWRCDEWGAPSGTVVLNWNYGHNTRRMLDTLAHEVWHLDNPPTGGDTTWERFREAEAYQYGREYAERSCVGNPLCEEAR